MGVVDSLEIHADGGKLSVLAPVAGHLAVSNSIAVNGCCLTVVKIENGCFFADLSAETLRKTSASEWQAGSRVNLEQPLTAGKELVGDIVLGHVDSTGRVRRLEAEGDNWWYGVEVPEDFTRNIVPQGSITIDGISLTVARSNGNVAEIAVIPYTYEHSNIRDRKIGDAVNLEGDVLGKYVERYMEARKIAKPVSALNIKDLLEQGF